MNKYLAGSFLVITWLAAACTPGNNRQSEILDKAVTGKASLSEVRVSTQYAKGFQLTYKEAFHADLLHIFHSDLLPDHTPVYYRPLK